MSNVPFEVGRGHKTALYLFMSLQLDVTLAFSSSYEYSFFQNLLDSLEKENEKTYINFELCYIIPETNCRKRKRMLFSSHERNMNFRICEFHHHGNYKWSINISNDYSYSFFWMKKKSDRNVI